MSTLSGLSLFPTASAVDFVFNETNERGSFAPARQVELETETLGLIRLMYLPQTKAWKIQTDGNEYTAIPLSKNEKQYWWSSLEARAKAISFSDFEKLIS